MRAARSDWRGSPARSGSCWATAKCVPELLPTTSTKEKNVIQVLRSLALAAALIALPAAAVEVGGVKFEDKTRLGGSELALNGAGIRTRAFFKVYSIGLYLPEKKGSAEAVLALKGAKRVRIVTLRDLTAQQFADALVEQIEKNHTEAELAALKPAVDEFKATLLALNAAPTGTVITIDFTPDAGTRLTVND